MIKYTYSKPISFMEKKSRNQPNFKYRRLENEEAEYVCKMIKDGYSNSEIMRVTGLPKDTVSNIRGGRCFEKLSKKYKTTKTIKKKSENLPTITVINICNYIKEYPTTNNSYLSELFGVSNYQIRDIRQGKSYRNITKKYMNRF